MIIVKLMGGLGNQMFQYAAGRRLAWHHKTQLRVDVSFLKGIQKGVIPRTYDLIHFNIEAGTASEGEVAEIVGQGNNILHAIFTKAKEISGLGGRRKSNILRERYFHFDPDLMEAPDNIYLDGYWQSPKYFEEIGQIIREEFTVKSPMAGRNRELSDFIASCDSVSLHVRRGDFVSDMRTHHTHGVMGTDYYDRCIDYVADRIKRPHYFVFSDDPEWAKNNLSMPFKKTFVNHNVSAKSYEDIRLMSQCKYHIIANSTFSWWGAWLSNNSHKIILAPRDWLKDKCHNTDDVIPAEWIKI